jgi:hypothetical protein
MPNGIKAAKAGGAGNVAFLRGAADQVHYRAGNYSNLGMMDYRVSVTGPLSPLPQGGVLPLPCGTIL